MSNKVKLSPGKVIQFKKYIHGASDLGSRLRVRFSGSKKGLSYNNGNNTAKLCPVSPGDLERVSTGLGKFVCLCGKEGIPTLIFVQLVLAPVHDGCFELVL